MTLIINKQTRKSVFRAFFKSLHKKKINSSKKHKTSQINPRHPLSKSETEKEQQNLWVAQYVPHGERQRRKRRKWKLGRIKRHQKGRRTERQRGTTENSEKQLRTRTPKLRGTDRPMRDLRFAQHWIVENNQSDILHFVFCLFFLYRMKDSLNSRVLHSFQKFHTWFHIIPH